MRRKPPNEDAVSEIVGEMLMLTIVLILLAVFSSSLSNYLPAPRDPSVTITMSYDAPARNVTLYHKGGDPIKTSDLTVIVENSSTMSRLTSTEAGFTVINYKGELNPGIFDLGDKINVTGVAGDCKISIATGHAVIYNALV
jgi:archaeal type IV pilus assembly protein PilA